MLSSKIVSASLALLLGAGSYGLVNAKMPINTQQSIEQKTDIEQVSIPKNVEQVTKQSDFSQQLKKDTVTTNSGTHTGHTGLNDGYHNTRENHSSQTQQVKEDTVTTNSGTHTGHTGLNDGYHNTSENHSSHKSSEHGSQKMGRHE